MAENKNDETENSERSDLKQENKLETLNKIEGYVEHCQNLFSNNDWEESVNESLNDVVTKIHSKETKIKEELEIVVKLKDAILKREEEFESQKEVIL